MFVGKEHKKPKLMFHFQVLIEEKVIHFYTCILEYRHS